MAAQVIPWNFPLLMLAWKIAPALAAGNTVVLKPASSTPLTALLFADVCRQADLPPGVVNIVTGPGEIGMALVTHPDVDKVAFTGSTAVGKEIGRAIAGSDKALTLELGGKAANIVFDDAPLDQAVEGIVNGIFFNQGEVCCAGQPAARPGVDRRAAHRASSRTACRTLRVGDPLDKNTDVGAINTRAQLAQDRRAGGGRAWPRAPSSTSRLRPARRAASSSARRCSPTSPRASRIAQEEIFGPVLSVLTFRTPDEAIEKANNTAYGLSAGRLDRQGQPDPGDGQAAPGRRRVGQHLQPVRPDEPVRRLQGVGLRSRGRPATACSPTCACEDR